MAAGALKFSTDHFTLKLGLFYAAYFFFGGVQLPFFPLWLEDRGLDARSIGLVIAAPSIVRIFATPIIAHQADRYQALKSTLVIASIVGMLAMSVVGVVEGTIAIFIAFIFAMAALSPMLSLSDAYALTGLSARGRAYGPVRLWGSVAFIAGNVGAGLILEIMAPGHLIWLIVSALVVVVIAARASLPGASLYWRRRNLRRRRCCATRYSWRWRWHRAWCKAATRCSTAFPRWNGAPLASTAP